LIIELVGKGSMLGITSLNHKDVYNFSVVALNDVKVCEINIDIITTIMKNNISFSSNIMRNLNKTVDSLLKKISSLYHKRTDEKIAEMLVMLANDIYLKQSFTITLSRKEMAEYANVATENLVRVLKSFETKKLISLKGKNISILDYNSLEILSKR